MKRYFPFAIIAAVLLAALAAGAFIYKSEKTELLRISNTPIPTPSLEPKQTLDSSRGLVTIEEYGDYQCPPCKNVHPVLKSIKAEFGDRVRFIFHHFPLIQIHPHAYIASQAAVAAGFQGRFWEMHDLIYRNQSYWSDASDARPIFIGYARQLGMDTDRFINDLASAQANSIIIDDMKRGQAFGVKATPTVFIDGREIPFEQLTLENLRNEVKKRVRE
jgi:protein-disulfide isomerase